MIWRLKVVYHTAVRCWKIDKYCIDWHEMQQETSKYNYAWNKTKNCMQRWKREIGIILKFCLKSKQTNKQNRHWQDMWGFLIWIQSAQRFTVLSMRSSSCGKSNIRQSSSRATSNSVLGQNAYAWLFSNPYTLVFLAVRKISTHLWS